MEYSISPVIMTVILLTVAAACCALSILMYIVVSRKNNSETQDKLIQVVMDIHDQSKFYHNAGRSSAEHQLQVERMHIEKVQAESEKAKYEARKMEEERMTRNQVGGFNEPKHGSKGHKRTVIESVGGVNG